MLLLSLGGRSAAAPAGGAKLLCNHSAAPLAGPCMALAQAKRNFWWRLIVTTLLGGGTAFTVEFKLFIAYTHGGILPRLLPSSSLHSGTSELFVTDCLKVGSAER